MTLPILDTAEGPVLLMALCCTGVALLAMACIAWHDCRRFEIHFEGLGLATLALVPVLLVAGGRSAVPDALLGAGLFGGATWIARRLHPARLGRGDIALMAFLGFVAGREGAVPVLAALCLFSALTAALYSIARGKRLFRSMFPAALPAMPAAALGLGLRLAAPAEQDIRLFAPVLDALVDVALPVTILASTVLVGLAFERRGKSARGGGQ
ncbi:prepilin peptidase [Ruegeria sp.]|uniref:prepilin peptidase n=1 Tax=Ruegeria sp. TaxID=1879320 RepID=UPI003AFFA2FD